MLQVPLGSGWPSLVQAMTGWGCPATEHGNVTSDPAAASCVSGTCLKVGRPFSNKGHNQSVP